MKLQRNSRVSSGTALDANRVPKEQQTAIRNERATEYVDIAATLHSLTVKQELWLLEINLDAIQS